MRHGSIMTLISQLSLSGDISKEGSEGGFHFWTCFVAFTVVPLCHVWLSTTRLTGTTHPAFKKPTCGGHVHNTGFKLCVISGCTCLDLLVCRRAGGGSNTTSLQTFPLCFKGLVLFKLLWQCFLTTRRLHPLPLKW